MAILQEVQGGTCQREDKKSGEKWTVQNERWATVVQGIFRRTEAH